MKGNTGRLKRSSSRRWRLAIFLLGVASPFALYWFVTGGGNASGDRLGDSSRLGSWEGGRGFGATHARPETSPSERSVVSCDMLKAAIERQAYGAPGSVVEFAHDGL